MKKFVSLFLALTLTCTLATIPSLASSNRHGYDGYIGTYDMDPKSDNGNGVIIYSCQYPNGCDFCGSGYRVEAR